MPSGGDNLGDFGSKSPVCPECSIAYVPKSWQFSKKWDRPDPFADLEVARSSRAGRANALAGKPGIGHHYSFPDVKARSFLLSSDPTTLNRQGPDVGTQYRSAIFHHPPQQAVAAALSKEKLEQSGVYRAPIVTEITPAGTFWPAEEYHQRYFEQHGISH